MYASGSGDRMSKPVPVYSYQYAFAISQLPYDNSFKDELHNFFDSNLPFDRERFDKIVPEFAKHYYHASSRFLKP